MTDDNNYLLPSEVVLLVDESRLQDWQKSYLIKDLNRAAAAGMPSACVSFGSFYPLYPFYLSVKYDSSLAFHDALHGGHPWVEPGGKLGVPTHEAHQIAQEINRKLKILLASRHFESSPTTEIQVGPENSLSPPMFGAHEAAVAANAAGVGCQFR